MRKTALCRGWSRMVEDGREWASMGEDGLGGDIAADFSLGRSRSRSTSRSRGQSSRGHGPEARQRAITLQRE